MSPLILREQLFKLSQGFLTTRDSFMKFGGPSLRQFCRSNFSSNWLFDFSFSKTLIELQELNIPHTAITESFNQYLNDISAVLKRAMISRENEMRFRIAP